MANTTEKEAPMATKTDKTKAKIEAAQRELTAKVIDSLTNDPGNWTKSWNWAGGLPRNPVTGRAYNGGNVLWLLAEANMNGYASNEWAGYGQWEKFRTVDGEKVRVRGVRKGEKSTPIIYWVTIVPREDDAKPNGDPKQPFRYPKVLNVFNAAQVDGYEPEVRDPVDTIELAEEFFAAQGATIGEGQPSYRPSMDWIFMPPIDTFVDAESYYATLAHEHGHWTGAKKRLNRPGIVEFDGHGTPQYAFEELIAELTALFVSAELGLTPEPRPDHAQYIASWIKALKDDHTLVWKAATAAAAAHKFLCDNAPGVCVPGEPEEGFVSFEDRKNETRELAKS